MHRQASFFLFALLCSLLCVSFRAEAEPHEAFETAASVPGTMAATDRAVGAWMKSAVAAEEDGSKPVHRGPQPVRREHTGESRRADVGTVRLIWPMAVVLGLIAVAAFAAKRWLPMMTRPSTGRGVHILSRQYLSSKQSLCVLRLGQRVVLVGVTPTSTTRCPSRRTQRLCLLDRYCRDRM